LKNKRNPLQFLETSLQSLKGMLGGGPGDTPMFFDEAFVRSLKPKLQEIGQWCAGLNKDMELMQQLNRLADPQDQNELLFKAEHFFLSDLLAIYEQLLPKASERSGFVLAYYYDVLHNDHFADAGEVAALNQLVAGEAFRQQVVKIRREQSLSTLKTKGPTYFLTHVSASNQPGLSAQILAYYTHFIESAFELKFKQPQDIREFFDLKAAKKQAPHANTKAVAETDSLDKALQELNQLIGLQEVKADVNALINLLSVQKKRTAKGLKNAEFSLHTVFLGPPGTGKTSVARLLGRIFKHLGYLSEGQCYETDREGLVAGYVGQTAAKVEKVVQESLGGVLFIDEAYALTQNPTGSDYGSEAVNTLLKRMEDHREDFAVVVAGYTEPMKQFIESNPGLRSRFNRYFYFDHFKAPELVEIFESFCKQSDFVLTVDAKEKLTDTFELLYAQKDENFGNARVARNLFEKCIQHQANRLVKIARPSQKVLKTLEEQDIPEPKDTLEDMQLILETE
jgi:stage V sporulation protein K